jgi:hypothetical protein
MSLAQIQPEPFHGIEFGRVWCFGKTPMQAFLDAKPLAKEKLIAA